MTDGIFWSVNQTNLATGGTDGEWEFVDSSDGNEPPVAANAANIAKIRIGRLQFNDGDYFAIDADADYGTALAGRVVNDTLKIYPYSPETGVRDAANYWTFTVSAVAVLTDRSGTDQDYYTLTGTAVATGSPANNGNNYWQFVFEESDVQVLGDRIVGSAGMIRGDTEEHPDGALARQSGQIRHWPLADMRAHVLGPDTKTLTVGDYIPVANIPNSDNRFYIGSESSGLRQVNITWQGATELAHLEDFLVQASRWTFGTWEFEVAALVTKNTIANGGFQTQVKTISGSPPATGGGTAIDLKVLGRVMHWNDAGNAGDVLYHDGTEWQKLAKGTDGQVLKLASGVPTWGNAGGGPELVVSKSVVLTSSNYQSFLNSDELSSLQTAMAGKSHVIISTAKASGSADSYTLWLATMVLGIWPWPDDNTKLFAQGHVLTENYLRRLRATVRDTYVSVAFENVSNEAKQWPASTDPVAIKIYVM